LISVRSDESASCLENGTSEILLVGRLDRKRIHQLTRNTELTRRETMSTVCIRRQRAGSNRDLEL